MPSEEKKGKKKVPIPVVVHEWVQVICISIFVYILAGSVDVGGHISATAERLVIHVVRLIFTTSKTTVHTLKRKREKRLRSSLIWNWNFQLHLSSQQKAQDVNAGRVELKTCENHSNLALIEESLVVLRLAGGTRVGLAQSDELTDVPVLISLQLRPGTRKEEIKRTLSRNQRQDRRNDS